MQASACAAKASFSSIRSSVATPSPARASALRVAGTGPMPMTLGSTPATAVATMRASGRQPSASAALRRRPGSAAAPSLMPLELPAVTVPPSRKAGGSLAELLRRDPGPRVLVAVDDVGLALARGISTGTISSAKTPAAMAACGPPLALGGELVLLLAGDAVAARPRSRRSRPARWSSRRASAGW